jgi:hypothetical protein
VSSWLRVGLLDEAGYIVGLAAGSAVTRFLVDLHLNLHHREKYLLALLGINGGYKLGCAKI